MSLQAMAWAIAQQRVTDPSARHVLLVLAQTASPEGEDAWRTVSRLMTETGLSERCVRMKLRDLLASGVMRLGDQAVVAVKIHDPARRPTVYDLDMRAEELTAAGYMNRKPRGAQVAPLLAGGEIGDNLGATGAENVPRGANNVAEGCKSGAGTGAPGAPTPEALKERSSAPAQTGAGAKTRPPARRPRNYNDPEDPLEAAINQLNHLYRMGAFEGFDSPEAERDRQIAEARDRHRHRPATEA